MGSASKLFCKKGGKNQQLLEQQTKISAYSAYNKSVLHRSFTQSLKPLQLNNKPQALYILQLCPGHLKKTY
jgi:hypothetical protein